MLLEGCKVPQSFGTNKARNLKLGGKDTPRGGTSACRAQGLPCYGTVGAKSGGTHGAQCTPLPSCTPDVCMRAVSVHVSVRTHNLAELRAKQNDCRVPMWV